MPRKSKVKGADALINLKKDLLTLLTCDYEVRLSHCAGAILEVIVDSENSLSARKILPLSYDGHQLVVIRGKIENSESSEWIETI